MTRKHHHDSNEGPDRNRRPLFVRSFVTTMPALPGVRIWRHHLQRTLRYESKADLAPAVLLWAAALFGILALAAALIMLNGGMLMEAENSTFTVGTRGAGLEAFAASASALMENHVLTAALIILFLYLWLSAHDTPDLRPYRFYPISLAEIALLAQLIRALSARYFAFAAAATCAMGLLSRYISFGHVISSVLLASALDAITIVLQGLHARARWIVHFFLTAWFAMVIVDAYLGHILSAYFYASAIRMKVGVSVPFLLLCAFILVLNVAAHYEISAQIRYGYD